MKKMKIKTLFIHPESESFEFKSSLSQLDRIVETVSAFANTKGGTIVIGLTGKGEVIGTQIGKDTIEKLTNKILSNTEPKVYPEISVKKIEGKSLIFIKVAECSFDVVLAFGRPYKRVGKNTVRMSKDEYQRRILEIHKRELYFDGQICPEAKLKDIDENKLKRFVDKARRERKLLFEENLSLKEILTRLKLMRDGKLTNAAVLLFGKCPQDFFIQSGVKCIRFRGLDVTDEMIDFKEIENDLISEVEDVENFIYNNIALKAWIEEGKIERQEKWEYPPKAIREALVNAIAHRDYRSPAKVQVRIFDDRIEFWNPGRLPKGWTVETLKEKHTSEPFNPLLFRMFFWIGYVEEVGTGTNRIINWCKEWELPEPEFGISGSSLFITFRKDIYTEEYLKKIGLNERQIKAVMYVKEKMKITNREYREICNTSERTATRDLTDLVVRDILEQTGITGKGTSYTLKTPQRRQSRQKDATKTPKDSKGQ